MSSAEVAQEESNLNKDNWEHRSIGMICLCCMFYTPKGGTILGRCRKHAPTMSGYPAVYNSDWCGDHKMNESFAGINQPISQENN